MRILKAYLQYKFTAQRVTEVSDNFKQSRGRQWPGWYANRSLLSSKNPHFQVHNLSCENEFYLHQNETLFPYQRLRT